MSFVITYFSVFFGTVGTLYAVNVIKNNIFKVTKEPNLRYATVGTHDANGIKDNLSSLS